MPIPGSVSAPSGFNPQSSSAAKAGVRMAQRRGLESLLLASARPSAYETYPNPTVVGTAQTGNVIANAANDPPAVAYSSTYSAPPAVKSVVNGFIVPVFLDTIGTHNRAAFTNYGWTPTYVSGNVQCATTENGYQGSSTAYTGGSYVYAYEFEVTSAQIELIFRIGANSTAPSFVQLWQIFVDGVLQTPTASGAMIQVASAIGATSGAGSYINQILTWTGPASRHLIRVKCANTGAFAGVVIGTNDTIQASSEPHGLQVLSIGDSYQDGNGAQLTVGFQYMPYQNYPLDTFPNILSAMLNAPDFWADAQGGTGFVTNPGGSKTTYINRLINAIACFTNGPSPMWQRLQPDVVFIQGSVNDGTTGLAAAVQACISLVRATWPNAFIVLSGIMFANGYAYWGTTFKQVHQILQSFTPQVDLFIDTATGNWQRGNGSSASSYATPLTFASVGASSATFASNFLGTTGSGTYKLIFADGTIADGVTMTNGSTAVSWTASSGTPTALSANWATYRTGWVRGKGSFGYPYSGTLVFTGSLLTGATSATIDHTVSASGVSLNNSGGGYVGYVVSNGTIVFSDGETRTGVAFTQGGTAVSWTGGLTGGVTATAQFFAADGGTDPALSYCGNADIYLGNSPHNTPAWNVMAGQALARYLWAAVGA